jgi:hypothetical protein
MYTKNRIFTVLLIPILVCVSCQSNSNSGSSSQQDNTLKDSLVGTSDTLGLEVPFTEAERYFVNNTYSNTQIDELKIDTQEEFDRIFGMAAVMGEDGTPTSIDFAKEYVLAVIGTVTDKKTTIKANHVFVQGGEVILKYRLEEGEKQSYTTHPNLLVVLDRKYNGTAVFKKE